MSSNLQNSNPDVPRKSQKLRFLLINFEPTHRLTYKEAIKIIDRKWREEFGGPRTPPYMVDKIDHNWQQMMTPKHDLKDTAINAVCAHFGIRRETWDSPQFYKRAAEEMRAKGKLVCDPPILMPAMRLGSRDIWELSAEAREVELTLKKDAAEMFGLLNGGPIIPTFINEELVKLGVSLDFDASLTLIHVPPSREKNHYLVVPSMFMRDNHLPAGQSVLPTEAPAEHPLAFAIHHPIGVHYLLAIAVDPDANIALPGPAPDMKPRLLSLGEIDSLEASLNKLAPNQYGVGVACYQVAS